MAGGWGEVFGKIFNWIPNKREYYQNKIAAVKKEMADVQKTKPFDGRKYVRLADQLQLLEDNEKRAS